MDESKASPAVPTARTEPDRVPLRFQGRRALAVVLLLEVLAVAGAVVLLNWKGTDALGHGLAVLLVPAVLLSGLGLFLCAWRAAIRRRSFLGWILLLSHLGSFVVLATVLAAGLRMKGADFLAFERQELDLFLQALSKESVAEPAVEAGFLKAIEPGSEGIGEAVAIEVPDDEPGRGDSLLVKGLQGWDVLVRHDSASEAVGRTLLMGARRVPLAYPDSGEAWTASGEVLMLQCHHEPVAAVAQLGLCPRRTAEPSADQGYGCEEPVVPHQLIVNLRTGKTRLLPSEVESDAALDSAQAWFRGEGCAG